jgi:hypothetical protein
MKYILIAYLTAAFCVVATADEVKLNNGRTLVGIARHEEPNRVVVETRFGDLRFPADQVQAIEPGRTDLHEYKERFDAIQGGCPSAADVFTLAQWAQEKGLVRYVNPLLTQTIELDPDHAEARHLLGYVKYEGNWMFPGERDAIVKSRAAEHRTMVEKTKTRPVRRTTAPVEETPYSLGLPQVPNRSYTDVYPPRSPYNSGNGSYGGGYVMSIGGVTPGGDVVLTYPIRTGTTGVSAPVRTATGGGYRIR